MKTRKWTNSIILSILVSLSLVACSPGTPAASFSANPTINIPVPTDVPAWVNIPLTDAKTGNTFTVSELKNKVVLVEGMATWCPTCWAQGNEIKTLKQELNAGEDFIVISLAMDRKESASDLTEYASIGGYDWFFVTSTIDIYRDIGNRYGATYLDPTLVPMFIIDKQGNIQNFRKGKMTAGELKTLIQPLLESGA